ncbi:uncharacterized protein BDW43DRAFT_284006 [Aspergillus alliaceus]|uniref:uncharacterized protein n=1 Tax=Petromyces alliaceus TaxID=209559 RepID=UPI0012A6ADE9|nr:uncharacterized protein BDW43DRAFT_284006 [Aspergillus alliaceus]KAB8231010.1 hypothetical protein BDW43DRAFT_284006 [Aspergillus alliaceus]
MLKSKPNKNPQYSIPYMLRSIATGISSFMVNFTGQICKSPSQLATDRSYPPEKAKERKYSKKKDKENETIARCEYCPGPLNKECHGNAEKNSKHVTTSWYLKIHGKRKENQNKNPSLSERKKNHHPENNQYLYGHNVGNQETSLQIPVAPVPCPANP